MFCYRDSIAKRPPRVRYCFRLFLLQFVTFSRQAEIAEPTAISPQFMLGVIARVKKEGPLTGPFGVVPASNSTATNS